MKKQPTAFQKGITGGLMSLMLLSAIPPSAHAQAPSLAELQAKILELQATIASLAGTTTGTTLGAYTWSTPLRLGSTGDAVRELQRFLNLDPETRVAISGPGSPGNETTYFGPATAAAVSKFQTKYRSEILTPSGLTNPTGFFGPSSIAKANALRNATAVNPTQPTTPTTPEAPSQGELSGDGELRTLILDDADDTDIREGAGEATIANLTVEAQNGDIRLDRMDIRLTADSGNVERDPWDTFSSISLVVDGEEIASKRIDNRSDFQNRTSGIVRLSNINAVFSEDEEVEIEIVVSVQNNVRGVGTAANWSVSPVALRYFDADRVATTDTTTGDLGESADFAIVPRGEGEELKFVIGRNNPDSTTIVVSDDSRTNNVTILEYDITAAESDIEIETLAVNIETGTAQFSDVVHAVRLLVGNTSFRSQSITTTGDYSTSSVLATFDIDNKVTVDADETVRVRVVADFKPQTTYSNGETIMAQVTSVERDLTKAEGSDDVSDFSGSAIGETHRLIANGVSVDSETVVFTNSTTGQNNNVGIYTIAFEVTAIEGDYFIKRTASTTADTSSGGIGFAIEGNPAMTVLSATLNSTGRENNSDAIIVREGRTETFTLTIVADPVDAGQYRALATNVVFSKVSDGVTNSKSYTLEPSNFFRTPFQFINN